MISPRPRSKYFAFHLQSFDTLDDFLLDSFLLIPTFPLPGVWVPVKERDRVQSVKEQNIYRTCNNNNKKIITKQQLKGSRLRRTRVQPSFLYNKRKQNNEYRYQNDITTMMETTTPRRAYSMLSSFCCCGFLSSLVHFFTVHFDNDTK